MSRARNLKPGFFKNDVLAECPPLVRILFQGLWCEADREGRLEDRPKRLKAEILPYDDIDIDASLNLLADKGFIVRYSHGSGQYIQILAFHKHQNPHVKESASSIPAPGEHSARTVQAPDQTENSTEVAGLIPDSLNPITDSRERRAPAGAPPRASRLAADWSLPDAYRSEALRIAAEAGRRVDPNAEAAKFRDYWVAKAGKDAAKADWLATWRNWIRRACENAPAVGVAPTLGDDL